MNKIKAMLFSIALFAVIGAALAFKAKGNFEFCWTTCAPIPDQAQGGRLTCPFNCPIIQGYTLEVPDEWVCYTHTIDENWCDQVNSACQIEPMNVNRD